MLRPRVNTTAHTIRISALEVDRLRFKLNRSMGSAHSNLTTLLDQLGSDTTSSDQPDWRIRCARFDLRDVHFSFHDEHEEPIPFGVDLDHIDLSQVTVVGTGLDVIGDSITAQFHQFQFQEKSGLSLERLSGLAQVGPSGIRITDMLLRTSQSELAGDLELLTESWADHDDFTQLVRWRMQLDSSLLEFADVAFFAPELQGVRLPITLSGRVRGTIAELKGRDLRINFGERSYFRGNAELSGLPDIDNTFLLVDIADLATDPADLAALPKPPFTSGARLQLPEEIASFGPMRFDGNFTGFLRAFTAYGDLRSDLGRVRTDLSYERDTISDRFRLSGRLATDGFDLGGLLGTTTLGNMAARLRIEASGRTFKQVKADLDGQIPSLTVNGTTITNITTKGTLEKDLFNGELTVVDDNLVLDFKGLADLRGQWPIVDFTADLEHGNLGAFGMAPRPGYHSISAIVEAKGRLSPDSLQGRLLASEITYCDDIGDHDLGYIQVESDRMEGQDVLLVDATGLEAEVRGSFLPTRIPDLLTNMVYSVFPALADEVNYTHEPQDLRFKITMRDPDELLGVFVPDLRLAPGTTFEGSLDSRRFDMEFIANIPELQYGSFRADSTRIIMEKALDVLAFSLRSDRQSIGDSTWIAGSAFTGKAYQDELELSVGWENSASGTSGDLDVQGLVNGVNDLSLDLLPSKLLLGRGDWTNPRVAHFTVKGDSIQVDTLILLNDDQRISLSGHINKDPEKALHFELENVALENITPYLGGPLITGVLGGSGSVHALYGTPYLVSDLQDRFARGRGWSRRRYPLRSHLGR